LSASLASLKGRDTEVRTASGSYPSIYYARRINCMGGRGWERLAQYEL
jgi:hypothetical protein